MTLPFYKLQLAGNGTILVDFSHVNPPGHMTREEAVSDFGPDRQSIAAIRMCDRKYGIGASSVVFLYADNTIRIWDQAGVQLSEADDALLCAARYAFDAGRAVNRTLTFRLPRGEKTLKILGAHEFRLQIGSAFTFPGGTLISRDAAEITEYIEYDGVRTAFSALHLRENALVSFRTPGGSIDLRTLSRLARQAFPGQAVLPVSVRVLTRDTLAVAVPAERPSSCSSAAAAGVCAAIAAGSCDSGALVLFGPEKIGARPDEAIARDRDNSRRLAVEWDAEDNDFSVIGSGGYVFEGRFDAPSD